MQSTKIWDNFTRIYHFSQLILLALMWYSGEQGDFELHFICGFALLALWGTRLLWGFIGSDTSRFTHFIKSPWAVIKAWRGNSITTPHIGHNPVGGYMVLALLISLGVQLFSGLFASDDVFSEGPLYSLFSESTAEQLDSLHHFNFNILLILIAVHALAGILHFFRGDNVLLAIVSGNKKLPLKNSTSLSFKSALMPLVLWATLFTLLYSSWGTAI